MATKKTENVEEKVEEVVEVKEEPKKTISKKTSTKKTEAAKVTEEAPVVKEKKEPKTKKGRVVGCERLFVRATPSPTGLIKGVIRKGDVVTIDNTASTEDFYKINTAFIYGFCMKKFIG